MTVGVLIKQNRQKTGGAAGAAEFATEPAIRAKIAKLIALVEELRCLPNIKSLWPWSRVMKQPADPQMVVEALERHWRKS